MVQRQSNEVPSFPPTDKDHTFKTLLASVSLDFSHQTLAVRNPKQAIPEPIYPFRIQPGNPLLQLKDRPTMSSDVAATILFGDLRYSYEKQLTRVERLRAISSSLEAQFLASVRERATRPNSSVSDEEKKDHEGLRRLLNRARLQLSDEVRLLQWLRRRHNMAIIGRKAQSRFLVF